MVNILFSQKTLKFKIKNEKLITNIEQSFETKAIKGQIERTQYKEHSVPVFLSSSFTFSSAEEMASTFRGETDATIYSRYSHPNTDELIQKVRALEETEGGFATPYIQRPSKVDADLIVHSGTKWMDGHDRVLGGLLVGKAEMKEEIRRHTDLQE